MINNNFIKNYLKEAKDIIDLISIEDIDKIINILFNAWKKDSIVFVMGNGGSSSTASHFAADLEKYTFRSSSDKDNNQKRFRVKCLTDNPALISAWTNDAGFETIFKEQLEPWISKNDVVVAFSVHGGSLDKKKGQWSQNITNALSLAKKRGAKIIGFSGDKGGALKSFSDACLVIPSINVNTVTPQVEGFHLVIHHLIVHRLRQLIKTSYSK